MGYSSLIHKRRELDKISDSQTLMTVRIIQDDFNIYVSQPHPVEILILWPTRAVQRTCIFRKLLKCF